MDLHASIALYWLRFTIGYPSGFETMAHFETIVPDQEVFRHIEAFVQYGLLAVHTGHPVHDVPFQLQASPVACFISYCATQKSD